MSDHKLRVGRTYDSTVARMAGNIAPAILSSRSIFDYKADTEILTAVAVASVAIARAIIAEVARTEPEVPS